jgi:hypothetical protein
MKKKQTMKKMLATAAVAVAGIAPNFAQTNLGAACGCPDVNSRGSIINMSTLVDGNNELTADATLDCSHKYLIDNKIYVPSGKTLTIKPGTVIYGKSGNSAANASALVVEKGGKIIADGTAECPIVFTSDQDPMDGSYALTHKGDWGGVLIAGKANNWLTLAANGPFDGTGNGFLAVADGIGTFEGFASTNSRDQFGTAPGSADDNDNSGILRYVSIRFAGSILTVGGEINGLTLGSVGRGTTIEHIDIISCADDAIEFFGGTVNVKYVTMLFGNDDMFDWDQGYSGKAQFIFGMTADQSSGTPSVDADNGFEMDTDDNKAYSNPTSSSVWMAKPIIFNATMISNGKNTKTSDNSGCAAMRAKELTGGQIYNSLFANFKTGLNISKALGSASTSTVNGTPRTVQRTGTDEAWANWATTGGNGQGLLKIKCNTFVNVAYPFNLDSKLDGTPTSHLDGSTTDTAQFYTTDKNKAVSTLAGFDYAWAANNNANPLTVGTISHKVDAVPNPSLSTSGCPSVSSFNSDGFFSTADYKGAFGASSNGNWMSSFTYLSVLGGAKGIVPCPTDTNADGVTNVTDFLDVLGNFNGTCN